MANTGGVSRTEQIREDLARSLGFDDYPENKLAEPYLNYIENRYTGTGSGTLEEYMTLFCKVVKYFTKVGSPQDSVQVYIDGLCNSMTEPLFVDTQEKEPRAELVADTVLYILGTWIAALSYFIKVGGFRQVELAYCIKQGKDVTKGYDVAREATLPNLLKGSGLFVSLNEPLDFRTPSASSTSETTAATSSTYPNLQFIHYSQIDSLESVSIKSTRLNAYTLSSLADTRICWTLNLSRHLLLTKIRGQYVVEVFALPCMLRGSSMLVKAGVPASLIHEIQESYSIFFNPFSSHSNHRRIGSVIGLSYWCWCRSCASMRLQQREIKNLKGKTTAASRRRAGDRAKSEFDPLLELLMVNPEREDWSYALFPHLWQRVLALEEHLHTTKPWNFWVLFRDRRDTLQFWTFFFGTVILFLTFLQVALGAAQVAGGFKPPNSSTGG